MAKYAYEDNPQLSPHFSAREFRCKCSSPHTFQVSEQLISMLEQLYAALDCGKIIVSSATAVQHMTRQLAETEQDSTPKVRRQTWCAMTSQAA